MYLCVLAPCKDREPSSEAEALWNGKPGVAVMDFRMLLDDSEMGGEGGVAAEEMSDDFIGGVANKGEDTIDVAGERSKISGVCGVDGLRPKGAGFLRRLPFMSAFRSFSWTISVSILCSDSSLRMR